MGLVPRAGDALRLDVFGALQCWMARVSVARVWPLGMGCRWRLSAIAARVGDAWWSVEGIVGSEGGGGRACIALKCFRRSLTA
jgi:hypothetical protein